MKKSIFGFILAILLICPFMSQVLRAEARDTDSKVTDADKISYYSFDNISGGLIADEWGSRNAVLSCTNNILWFFILHNVFLMLKFPF